MKADGGRVKEANKRKKTRMALERRHISQEIQHFLLCDQNPIEKDVKIMGEFFSSIKSLTFAGYLGGNVYDHSSQPREPNAVMGYFAQCWAHLYNDKPMPAVKFIEFDSQDYTDAAEGKVS
jgi:hypothetical protein